MRGNVIGAVNRQKTSPVPVQRTVRNIQNRILTSLPAGKMVPIMALPLLREDSVTSAQYRFGFEMSETVQLLMNAVNVRVLAYFVPKLAFERFGGSMDHLNKSYEGQPLVAGGAVTPWFETGPFSNHGIDKIAYYLGLHARQGQIVNLDYYEAYNAIWNFRARNRSREIPLRNKDDFWLAPAFWQHQTFAHIVPDFDQAIIDGEVPLDVIAGTKPPPQKSYVEGLGIIGTTGTADRTNDSVREAGKTSPTVYPKGFYSTTNFNAMRAMEGNEQYPDIFVTTDAGAVFEEMITQGVRISLANIELARKTQAFANLRRQYQGHSDEYIIDLLMDGIAVPEEAWKQPMLLADVSTVFGMSKRYASDGASLTESVVNGLTYVDVRFSVPRANTGGVVMIVAEIAPEQLFERQADPYFLARSVDDLPQFLRDTLDPEKVVVVKNQEIDVAHETPDGTFGYAPLNHQWAKSRPNVGGKFIRPSVDEEFDEDRQRIWAVETKNPVLSEDFYLVSEMHYKPFVVTDTSIDPFECLGRGQASIAGNTVFGGLLVEASDDYDKVLEQAPTDRIVKPAATEGEAPSPEQQPG